MSTDALEKSIAAARQALAGVQADQLDQPTPCASWNVRELANHMVGGVHFFAGSLDGDNAEADADSPDFTEGDLVAAYDEGAARAVAAFGADGALDQTVDLPFGSMPASAWMGLATTDQFVHAWDLARATDQQIDVDQDLAAELLAGSQASIQDAFRGPDPDVPFGPEVEIADDGAAADRLAAFLGRQV